MIDAGKIEIKRPRARELRRLARQEAVAGWRSRVEAPLPRDLLFEDLFAAYLAHLERSIADGHSAPSTMQDVDSCGELYLLSAFAGLRAALITTADVRGWVLQLRAIKNPKPLAPKYVIKIHGFLRAVLELGRARGIYETNVAAKLPPGTLPENETRPGFDPTREMPSLDQLVRLVSDQRWPLYRRIFWAILGTTGAREGEVIALEFRDVDREASPCWALNITKSFCAKTHKIGPTKTRQHKLAAIHMDIVAPLIEEFLSTGYRRLHGRQWFPGDILIAHPYRGTGLPSYYPDNTALRHFKNAMGKEATRVHSLRHFFVQTTEEAGADAEAVRSITHPPTSQSDGFSTYRRVSFRRRCAVSKTIVAKLNGAQLSLFTGDERGSR